MKKINVLFIPHPMPAHLIPLLSLAKKLDDNNFSTAFLTPNKFHYHIKNVSLRPLEINRKPEEKLFPELTAISTFKPDVIVDDLNYFTAFSSAMMNIPRVSIVRRGIIPHESHGPDFRHSSEIVQYLKDLDQTDFSRLPMEKPKSVSDLFKGKANIIPSIPSVEPLPEELKSNGSYIYSGPLTLGDNDMVGPDSLSEDVIASVEKFLRANEQKKIVYVDLGIDQPKTVVEKITPCINALLKRPDIAVITNFISFECENRDAQSRLYSAGFLPSNLIYSKAHLVVHKCGSGTYGFQLNYQVPAIIMGSNFYDRDEIAKRLEELGAADYLPASLDKNECFRLFDQYATQLLDKTTDKYSKQKNSLAKLGQEIQEFQGSFDFGGIIKTIAGSAK